MEAYPYQNSKVSDPLADFVDGFIPKFTEYKNVCIGLMCSVLDRYYMRPNKIDISFIEDARIAVENAERLEPIYELLSKSERDIIDSINEKIRPIIEY